MSYKLVYLLLCMGVWLVPFFMTGWTRRVWKVFPQAMSFQQNAAALFTHGMKTWRDYHLEWKREDGSWFEIDKRALFSAVTFGERTRFDRILSKRWPAKTREQVLFKIADHAVRHGRKTGLLNEDVVGLRLVVTSWDVGSPELTHPSGAWIRAKAVELPDSRRQVLVEYEIQGEAVIPLKRAKASIQNKGQPAPPNPLIRPPERLLVPAQTPAKPVRAISPPPEIQTPPKARQPTLPDR